jgi:predicted ABC-type sugar transport system permease subunit
LATTGAIASPSSASRVRLLRLLLATWSWVFLILICVFFEVYARLETGNTFLFRAHNLGAISVAASQTLFLALGLTLVIVASHIDLSIGFVTGLAAVVMAVVIRALDPFLAPVLSLLAGIVAAMLASLVPGFVNGWLVARLNVPSFICTLGMYGIARGMALLIAGGATVAIRNPAATYFGNQALLGVPLPVVLAIVVTLVFHYLLSQTRFGLHTYTIGGNVEAARRAGIDVQRHLIVLFMLSAFTAGLGGIVYTARFSAGAAQAGEPVLLYAVAAVFIGGASLTGGQGTIRGTLVGALIIAVIQFGLVFINVAPYWQFVAVGAVIIVAVLIDQARSRLHVGALT